MLRCGFLMSAACAALMLPALARPLHSAPAAPVVAVLDFDATSNAVKKQAANAPDKLTAALARKGTVRVVDRALVRQAIEQARDTPADALPAKVGAAVGANVVVAGQVSRLDKKLWVTCKVTDLRTNSVGAQVAKGPAEDHLEEIMQEMADKIGRSLASAASPSSPAAPAAPAAPASPAAPRTK